MKAYIHAMKLPEYEAGEQIIVLTERTEPEQAEINVKEVEPYHKDQKLLRWARKGDE